MRYELSQYEWDVIRPVLPNRTRGIPRVDDRRVLNGIFWILRSGAPWRDLPGEYGPYTTCYNRFNRWRKAGIWDAIYDTVANLENAATQMIDTSIVRVHQHAACVKRDVTSAIGRSRGGWTTKIHALVDGKGLPLRLTLGPGQEHDSLCAVDLLDGLEPGSVLLADRAYDSNAIREFASARGAWANIPPKRNRKDPKCFSPYLYRERNNVERFFNKVKHSRRVATRYDKLPENYLAMVKLAAIRIWLRANESTA